MESLTDDNYSEDAVESGPESSDGQTEAEELLGRVFQSCDVNSEGRVKVSTLVDYLIKESAAAENQEILGFLDDLAITLDPTGKDISIDCTMYNQGIRNWIQHVQSQRSFQEFDEPDAVPIEDRKNHSGTIYKGRGESNHNGHSLVNGYGDISLEDGSFYGSGSSNEWEKSQSEILGRIQELQIANKKLNEEKSKLRHQVDSTEEANSTLLHEKENMRNKLSKYEQLLERHKSVEKDYETLKNVVNEYQATRDQLLSKTTHLEKENLLLQGTVEGYQKKDTLKNTTIESIREENVELLQKLNEQKQLYADLESLQDLKQKMMDESSSKSEYMTSFIAELSMANEALKAEKNRLEVDLLESKHEISKLTAMNSPSTGIPREPIHASTPFQRDAPANLRQEIEAELVCSNFSASPKEHSGYLSGAETNGSRNGTNESGNSDISVSTAASSDKYSTVAQQIAINFKKKKEMALKQIAELAALDTKSESAEMSQVLVKSWEEEMDSFADEVQGLAMAKQTAERRSEKLMKSLKKVKAENKMLTDSRDRALQRVGDFSMTREGMEQRIEKLMEDIKAERVKVVDLTAENRKLTDQLNKEQHKNEVLRQEVVGLKEKASSPATKLKSNSDIKDHKDEQIEDLKSLVADLESRTREYTRQLFDVESITEQKDDIISKQLKDILRLEHSYSETSSRHANDMRDIFVMFSQPGEELPEHDASKPLSISLVKEKFEQYMASVKATLKNMGVRDGPVGSEGNDLPQIGNPENRQESDFIEIHRDLETKLKAGLSMQNETKSMVSIQSQTELRMTEVEEAMHAFTMLKILQQKDSNSNVIYDENYRSDFERLSDENGSLQEDFEISYENACPEGRQDFEINYVNGVSKGRPDLERESSEGRQDEKDFDTVTGLVMNERNDSIDRDELPEKYDTVSKIPGQMLGFNMNESSEDESRDVIAHLILGKSEDPDDLDIIQDHTEQQLTSEIRNENSNAAFRDAFSSNVDSEHEHFNEKSTTRRRMTRTVSVSTDESNTSDEYGAESPVIRRKKLAKQKDESPTASVESNSTSSSKRGRRIGVSAEPVRLPTWTELRESFKLNQQILMEEEMNSKELLQTPRVLLEVVEEKLSVNAEAEIVLAVDRGHVSEGDSSHSKLNAAEESMELCYEFPTETSEGAGTQDQAASQDFPIKSPESLHSIAGSEASAAESYQAPSISDRLSESREDHSAIAERISNADEEEKRSSVSYEKREDMRRSTARSSFGSAQQQQQQQQQQYQPTFRMPDSDRELEKRYNNAVLSFRTDQYTLQRRLENQERARDVAETGMEREIRKLAESVQTAEKVSLTLELKSIMKNLQRHTDVLRKAGMKVSAQAEQHGCFQQEAKAGQVIEIFINYAEYLRLCNERAKEAEESRQKEMLAIENSRHSRNDVANGKLKNGYCAKCHERMSNDSADKESSSPEGKKKEKSRSLTFFGLAKSILRERKKSARKEETIQEEETEKQVEDSESVDAKPICVNYSPNLETSRTERDVRSHRSRISHCDCVSTLIRFFFSVAILSAILFVFANYVEVDLALLNKNWNDKLTMYGKRFFNTGKKSAI